MSGPRGKGTCRRAESRGRGWARGVDGKSLKGVNIDAQRGGRGVWWGQMTLEKQPMGWKRVERGGLGRLEEGIKFGYCINMALEEPLGRDVQEEGVSWG